MARLASDINADSTTIKRVASLFEAMRERAPDLYVPAPGGIAAALSRAVLGPDSEPVFAALCEWALDAEGEPLERMRRDCLRVQSAATRGALRLYASEPQACSDNLLALQRFIFLQTSLLTSLAAKNQESGGVVRTLPTPEYAAFMEIFRAAIETHKQEGRQLGLLLLHVARVEQVDSLLGLQRGEAFMLRVTRRMREGVLRKQDQLGRVSRDQLACLLPRIAGEGVAILAANKILAALESPIPIGDRTFAPDAAIGIAMYPDHGNDQQTLVRNGKLAVRAARDLPERVAVYDTAHAESEERSVKHEARLRRAIEENTLDLLFEPQYDQKSGRVVGLECSLKWLDIELGEVSETQAVETALASGAIRELTLWVINSALRLCAEFSENSVLLPVAIKVTAHSLLQPEFPDFVGRALGTWKVPAERIVIQIHESTLLNDSSHVGDALARIKALGIRIAIDGFGSGSCSLGGLAQLPIDEVHIVPQFVTNMRGLPAHAKIVRSLAHLAQDLGLAVIADGVTDADTALALSTLGCDRIQGPYVGPPLTFRQVIDSGIGNAKALPLPVQVRSNGD